MRYLKAHGADTEQLGAVAADALDEIHCAVYGVAPEATRAWTDGDAILVVMRMQARSVIGTTPVTAIQRMVAAAVHRRTGVRLRTGGVNFDPERGLAVLAFERIEESVRHRSLSPVPAGPVSGAG